MPIDHSVFPNLSPSAYRIASPPTVTYNCLAWAAGVNDEWWDPAAGYSWPADLPRDVTVATLVQVYERHGFVVCDDAGLEPGFEKIAIYGTVDEWEHAARQLPNGKWTSKMGPDEDIEHDSLDDLAGGVFGSVVRFLKRPTPASQGTAAARPALPPP